MASTTPLSSVDPLKSILEDGIFYAEDPVVGKRVDEIIRKGFLFKTEEGLGLVKENILDDERIRNILESYFEWSSLGFYKAFGPDPSHAFSFLNWTNAEAKAEALIVVLCGSESRMVYYTGTQSLPRIFAKNGLLENCLSPARLAQQPGVNPVEVDMKDGGRVIYDGRFDFTILGGKVIKFGFATREELKEWNKMDLPNVEILKRKAAEMESTHIGMNFDFVKLGVGQ